MRFINRFCGRHPNFGIENLMLYISIGNVVFWLLSMVNATLMSYLTFSPYHILHGQVWRLFTFVLYPPATGMLALVAFYFYYWIGSTLEKYWGTARFNLYLLIGWALIVVYGFAVYFIFPNSIVSFGGMATEYIFLSLFFAFATMFPDTTVLLFFVIPIKIKWLAIVDVVFFVLTIIQSPFPSNLIPVMAVVNYLLFFWADILHFFKKNSKSADTINFRREVERIRKEQQSKLYNHKCAVCGRTDTEHPELEFRYCSRCQGYHCFCSDHINNHIHFTE